MSVEQSFADVSYEQYCNAFAVDPHSIQAWSLPSGLMKFVKDSKLILQELGKEAKLSVDALLTAFKSRELFSLFKAVGFSLGTLYKAFKALAGAPFKAILAALEDLVSSDLFQKLKSKAVKIDEVFNEHPILKKITGPLLAGLLIWMWMNSSFIGDLDFDFDVSYISQALRGSFSLTDMFLSADGLASLAVLGLGTFTGISIPWIASDIGCVLAALLFTAAKKMRNSELVQKLKPQLEITTIRSMFMKTIKTQNTAGATVEAGALDAVRASKLLQMIGIKGFELQDASNGYLVFSLHNFMEAVKPLTEFYGAAKNESNAGWATKRLIWSVPEVKGQVMLMQVANATPLLIFKQL